MRKDREREGDELNGRKKGEEKKRKKKKENKAKRLDCVWSGGVTEQTPGSRWLLPLSLFLALFCVGWPTHPSVSLPCLCVVVLRREKRRESGRDRQGSKVYGWMDEWMCSRVFRPAPPLHPWACVHACIWLFGMHAWVCLREATGGGGERTKHPLSVPCPALPCLPSTPMLTRRTDTQNRHQQIPRVPLAFPFFSYFHLIIQRRPHKPPLSP